MSTPAYVSTNPLNTISSRSVKSPKKKNEIKFYPKCIYTTFNIILKRRNRKLANNPAPRSMPSSIYLVLKVEPRLKNNLFLIERYIYFLITKSQQSDFCRFSNELLFEERVFFFQLMVLYHMYNTQLLYPKQRYIKKIH